ncbi:prostaglandin reductase 1-like [Procambarus clarkii]|uniref:prostaglandin reductase 1-like n=1 Tax=Procambarus clarkii TaxID=6728 RepID=UPI001E670309|nr:prostaglandin reductase 1-like [Procambarus clarkii]XP_045582932.1 prostaglandin reductase 1-like [Procambarus clarkii]XP_045582940.1 prostaglandin reductase 1-like [Procambarus clarkii]
MTTAKVWQLVRRPVGKPTPEDFACVEEQLPPCSDGDVITEAEYLSVDPYMRYRARQIPLNTTMVGSQVARVIESNNPQWSVGSFMVHYQGWRTHTHLSREFLQTKGNNVLPLPDMGELPRSLGIGILGMPGNTAYFGLLEICEPKADDTVLVNGAAGAVGSAVVQIAKIKGCKVIAFAGSDEKVAYVKELGADHVFNYKTTNVGEALKRVAPEKINCFFDNVGGQFTAEALPHLADFGRVAVCGAISSYNDDSKDIGAVTLTSPFSEATLIWKQLRVEGFLVYRWSDRIMEGLEKLKLWILEGKIKYRETLYDGFDKMPGAFIGLFDGENIGKAVVKA